MFTIVKIRKVYRFTWFTLGECIFCPYVIQSIVMAWFTGLLGLPGLYAIRVHCSIFTIVNITMVFRFAWFTVLLGLLTGMLTWLVYIFHG